MRAIISQRIGLDARFTLSPVLKAPTSLSKISNLFYEPITPRKEDTKRSIVAEARELSGKRIRAPPRERRGPGCIQIGIPQASPPRDQDIHGARL